MNEKVFITTTLPYANSKPHIGHSFEFIIGDALSRYYKNKLGNENVFFNIGLDEHGLKIQQASEKEGIYTKDFLNALAFSWDVFCSGFSIKYDNFYRTSNPIHIKKVQSVWKKQVEAGNIYKKFYSGFYCVGCESFKLEKDLTPKFVSGVDPAFENPEVHTAKFFTCPDHPTIELQETSEENYFFCLEKFKTALQDWRKNNQGFLFPAKKDVELDNIIENIQDISVSRNKVVVKWAVPVPNDDSQSVYVWFDALLNYIFSVGYDWDLDKFNEFWTNGKVIQICGPDNLKFQAVIFQAILSALGLKNTDNLLVHGTILDSEGRKMSKTTGNVINPVEQVRKYGIDAVRYYSLAGLSTFENTNWDEKQLIALYNSHLADNFGNLLARVLHLIDIKGIEVDHSLVQNDKRCALLDYRIETEIRPILERKFNFYDYCNQINDIVKGGNSYINDEKPWEDKPTAECTLLELHYLLTRVAELYEPIVPNAIQDVKHALRQNKKAIIFRKLQFEQNELKNV